MKSFSKECFLSLFLKQKIDSLEPAFPEVFFSLEGLHSDESLLPISLSKSNLPLEESVIFSSGKKFLKNRHHFDREAMDNYSYTHYTTPSISKTIFINNPLIKNPLDRVWSYIDEQNTIQGPFTSVEMNNWFEKGYFFNELKICHSSDKKFLSLLDWAIKQSKFESEKNRLVINEKIKNILFGREGLDDKQKDHEKKEEEKKVSFINKTRSLDYIEPSKDLKEKELQKQFRDVICLGEPKETEKVKEKRKEMIQEKKEEFEKVKFDDKPVQKVESVQPKQREPREINPNKMHIDKDKYYIVYQEKTPSKEKEEEVEDEENDSNKQPKFQKKKEKIYYEKKKKSLKFNQHLNENEGGKNLYKEYIPKKD